MRIYDMCMCEVRKERVSMLEAAEFLDMSEEEVKEELENGQLVGHKIKGNWRISRKALREYMERKQEGTDGQ